jgi:hypothetical protein
MKKLRQLAKSGKPKHWITLAGVLGSGEMVLPLFQDAMPRGVFAILAVLSCIGAAYSNYLQSQGDDA